jgi:glycosyltransferase involved in cell wall biosynthesis
MKPKVSIIMSTYNEPLNWITESIDSILNQTFTNFELIIINDNLNRKELFEFLNKYQKKDKRIKIINNKKNLGAARSRNRGLKIAQGKYIAIMDSDDISLPKRIEIQYNFLEENSGIFLVCSGAIMINEEGNLVREVPALVNKKKLIQRLEKKNTIFHSSILFRNKRGYKYREKFPYSQDYDLYLLILSDGKEISAIKDILIKYRVRTGSISFSKMAHQKLFAEKSREFYFERKNKGTDSYKKFNPKIITELNIETSTNKIVLESNIKANLGIGNYNKVRLLCKKYFKNYGAKNKFLLFYLFSFLGKNFISFTMKILPIKLLRFMNN